MAVTNNYGVVILSKVKSVYNGNIYSVQSAEELQNGFIGHLGDLKTGEREIRNLVKPLTATIATTGVVLVAHSEINYDESTKAQALLQNFKIEANTPARAYEIVPHDCIELSKNLITALSSETGVVVGNYVTATNDGYGYTESATLPTGAFAAKIIGKRTLGTTTFVGQPGSISGSIELIEIEILKNNY